MLRKMIFALAAVATLGLGVIASTEASARGHGGGHGFHGGGHRGGGGFHRGGGFRGFHGGGWHRGGGWNRGGWHRGGWHGGWRRGWHRPRYFVGGPRFYGGYGGCYVRRLVPTPWGFRYRLINRCY